MNRVFTAVCSFWLTVQTLSSSSEALVMFDVNMHTWNRRNTPKTKGKNWFGTCSVQGWAATAGTA